MAERYDAVDHRRRPQRPGQRGLPRAGRAEDARPRAAPRARRRRGHRGDGPGLPVLASSATSSRCCGPRSSASSSCRGTASTSCRSTARSRRSAGRGPTGAGRPTSRTGDYLWRVNDHGRTIRELRRWSKTDAEAYEEYGQLMVEMARFIKPILGDHAARPDLARPAAAAAARRPRPPLPAAAGAPAGGLRPADDDVARPTSSTSGSRPTRSRRRCARRGSSARTRASARRAPRTCCSTTTWARSTAPSAPGASRRAAPAAISNAIAQRGPGARRGDPDRGAGRADPRPATAGRPASCSRVGEEIEADVVLSSVDARRTFLDLLEPGTLDAEFEEEVRRFKFRGSSGKVNLAVDALPDFTSLPGAGEHLRGAISFSPSIDDMEQAYDDAKYGRFSREAVHRHDHPDPRRPDDGAARQARHQLLRPVRAVPARRRSSGRGTTSARRSATRSSTGSPSSRRTSATSILVRKVQTPLDIERTTGLTEGNIFQGELSLEQLFFNRPVARLRAVPDADPRPVAVRLVDASGRRDHGRQRPDRARSRSLRGRAAGEAA